MVYSSNVKTERVVDKEKANQLGECVTAIMLVCFWCDVCLISLCVGWLAFSYVVGAIFFWASLFPFKGWFKKGKG